VTSAIKTARLDLVPATYDLCVAEIEDSAALGKALGAVVPGDWPPPLNDEESQQFFMKTLRDRPAAVGWAVWYFIADTGTTRVLIGNGGFKGEPREGTVEIGYSIIPAFQRRGYASEAVEALVLWAFDDPRVSRVVAETFPDLAGSLGVLRKAGFRKCGGATEPGALRFERLKAHKEETTHYRDVGDQLPEGR
jgi:ribosomal-protein-alanine N-acetyltransferase